jgi:hypothetical protein
MRALLVLSFRAAAFVLLALLVGCGGSPKLQVRAMPEGGSFTGVWFSPQYGEMHILQSGSSAIGRYAKDERVGRLQGAVEGDIMRFEWTEERELIVGRPVQTRGHGYFRIVKDTAEDTWKLMGEWGNDAAERGGGPWNAVKSKTRKPEIDSAGNRVEAAYGESEGEGESESAIGKDDLSDL